MSNDLIDRIADWNIDQADEVQAALEAKDKRIEQLEAALREIAEYNEYAPAVDCVFIAKQALGEKE